MSPDNNETVASGAWCQICGQFYVDSDPSDPAECGHSVPDRIYADVVAVR